MYYFFGPKILSRYICFNWEVWKAELIESNCFFVDEDQPSEMKKYCKPIVISLHSHAADTILRRNSFHLFKIKSHQR